MKLDETCGCRKFECWASIWELVKVFENDQKGVCDMTPWDVLEILRGGSSGKD